MNYPLKCQLQEKYIMVKIKKKKNSYLHEENIHFCELVHVRFISIVSNTFSF